MDRAEKKELVTSLHEVFSKTTVIVVAHNKGLTVNQVNDLRGKMAQAGATVKVAKNTLLRIAIEKSGVDVSKLTDLLTNETVLITGKDPVLPAKLLMDFAKTNEKLQVKGGFFEGKVGHGF